MKIISRILYGAVFVLMLFSLTQAQIDTSKSTGTGTGIDSTGTGNTGTGNTGTDNTGSMGTGRTGTGINHTGMGTDTSRTGTGNTGIDNTGSMGTGRTGMDTSRTGTGNIGTDNTGSMGTGRTGMDTSRTGTGMNNSGMGMDSIRTGNTGTGNIGTGNTGDVTGGSRTGMGTSTSMIRSSIEDASSKFMQALNNGDINTALTFYTSDATLLPPDLDIIQGSTGISNFWTKITSMGLKFDTLSTADVRPSDDGQTVDEVGRYYLKIDRPGQAPVSEKGKFLFVWKRQPDNTWKIDTHMWNRSRQ